MGQQLKVDKMGKIVPLPNPTIPVIPGDGIGADIWPAVRQVLDTAATKYGRKIDWLEVLAGQAAYDASGEWLPQATIDAFATYLVGLKGPLTTPTGGGPRSMNVALRKALDLYACVRPVKWYPGVPSPVKDPANVDLVIFRENVEDVYAGLELAADSPEQAELSRFVADQYGWQLPDSCGVGLKPISEANSKRLVRAAINYALEHERRSVTLVHKGNIQKFTEGAFRAWGYEVVKDEFTDVAVSWDDCAGNPGSRLLVTDLIADNAFQQLILVPQRYDVIATTNLNGDYLSDATAAQIGGIGISPGANINYQTGHAIFEATHGTAPTIVGTGKANPAALLLSGAMLLAHIGWADAAADVEAALTSVIATGHVTADFAAQDPALTQVSTSDFADLVTAQLD